MWGCLHWFTLVLGVTSWVFGRRSLFFIRQLPFEEEAFLPSLLLARFLSNSSADIHCLLGILGSSVRSEVVFCTYLSVF